MDEPEFDDLVRWRLDEDGAAPPDNAEVFRDTFAGGMMRMLAQVSASGDEVRPGDEWVVCVFRRRGPMAAKEIRQLGKLCTERYGGLSVASAELPISQGFIDATREGPGG